MNTGIYVIDWYETTPCQSVISDQSKVTFSSSLELLSNDYCVLELCLYRLSRQSHKGHEQNLKVQRTVQYSNCTVQYCLLFWLYEQQMVARCQSSTLYRQEQYHEQYRQMWLTVACCEQGDSSKFYFRQGAAKFSCRLAGLRRYSTV